MKLALAIDNKNGNHLWRDSIKKEMDKAKVAYVPVEDVSVEDARQGKGGLIGYQQIECHLVFDVKMDFTRKARFVAGGHTTTTPAALTYASVVSRESVRVVFTLAAVNKLDVMGCNIGNAYLNAPCRERFGL